MPGPTGPTDGPLVAVRGGDGGNWSMDIEPLFPDGEPLLRGAIENA